MSFSIKGGSKNCFADTAKLMWMKVSLYESLNGKVAAESCGYARGGSH